MFSKITAVLAGMATFARGPDNRPRDMNTVALRHRRRRDDCDDFARDGRREHQERADRLGDDD